MTDHGPLISLQGTATRYFEEFLNNNNVFFDFSVKDRRAHFLNGNVWMPPVLDPLLDFKKLFRDYTWLSLLHGTISIPNYVIDYMRLYQDNQIDFAGLCCDFFDKLSGLGIVTVVTLDTSLSPEKKAAIFQDATETIHDVVSRNMDYFFTDSGDFKDTDRIFEIASLGDCILGERLSVAMGRPALYLEEYRKLLAYGGAYERVNNLSLLISEMLLPNIPVIEDYLDLAQLSDTIQGRINDRIAVLDEIRSSPAGKSFQAISSQVLSGGTELKRETIDSLKKVLEHQRHIRWLKKLTFYLVAASGTIGIFDPLTGGISLIASLSAPLILSRSQAKAWKKVDNDLPGIKYLYEVSKDIRSDYVIGAIARMEERISG